MFEFNCAGYFPPCKYFEQGYTSRIMSPPGTVAHCSFTHSTGELNSISPYNPSYDERSRIIKDMANMTMSTCYSLLCFGHLSSSFIFPPSLSLFFSLWASPSLCMTLFSLRGFLCTSHEPLRTILFLFITCTLHTVGAHLAPSLSYPAF